VEQVARRLYGRKTERVDPNQGELDLGPGAETAAGPAAGRVPEPDPAGEATRERQRHGRTKLPKDLPRTRIVLEPARGKGCDGRVEPARGRASDMTVAPPRRARPLHATGLSGNVRDAHR